MSKEQVEEYFHNLQLELDGVASENIFNFDGTNFTDDPKRKKVKILTSLNIFVILSRIPMLFYHKDIC